MKNKWLKLMSFLGLVLVISFGMVACQKQDATKKTETKTEDATKKEDKEKKDDNNVEGKKTEVDKKTEDSSTFVRAISKEPTSFNPDAVNDTATYLMSQNIFNKLVKINGQDRVVEDLAESFEFSEDGKTLTFKLKEAKWHDGEKFTAEDVKWTFDTIISKEGFAASSLSDIEEVVVKDPKTVEFKLKAPNAGILGTLAWQGTYIMPKHIYAEGDWLENKANQSPIGTGPFKFVEQKAGESVTLAKNPEFFGKIPEIDKIKFVVIPDSNTAYQAWLAGEIDDGAQIPEEEKAKLEKDENYKLIEKSWPNKSYFCFNVKEGKFANPLVRQAVLYGINIDEIFEKGLKGVGEKQKYFIPWQYKSFINTDIQSPQRDLKKAKELLEEAGYKPDAEGYYFETTIDTFPGWDEIMPIFQSQFKEFGINLKHNSMDDPTYDEKVLNKQDFEITVLGGYMGPDISSIANRFKTGGFMNYGLYSSAQMDELLEEGVRTTDESKRSEPYKKIQELLMKDLPVVFFSDKYATDYIKSYIQGHPSSEEAVNFCSESEYTYLKLNK